MAFVRKKGKSYYLVHNVREDGRVRQVHLACLGNRPRVSDEVIEQVKQSHPNLQIDWDAVRGRASETFASPFADVEGVQQLIRNLRNLTLDLHELDLQLLHSRVGERVPELLQEMGELRGALEQKLAQANKPPGAERVEPARQPEQEHAGS
jgi:hypothetical protein